MDTVIEILIEVFGEMFFECFSFDAIWLPKKPLSKRRQKIISVILLTITALAFFALVGALIFLIGTRGSSLLGWALLLFDLVYVCTNEFLIRITRSWNLFRYVRKICNRIITIPLQGAF